LTSTPSSDWALLPGAIDLVLEAIDGDRRAIVECGSGDSTLAIARRQTERGQGRHYSLEHDPDWPNDTRRRLVAAGLAARVEVIEAPLRPRGGAGDWYELSALDCLPPEIDLLLVDGPPADLQPDGQIRHPALPVLAPRLAEGAVVILDDIDRPGERAVLERWSREHSVNFTLRPEERVAIGVFSAP
jgi:predicted O-methyltransferase YrrM